VLVYEDLTRRIAAAELPAGMTTRIVAVDGPGGAGKSTLAARLAESLGGAAIVQTDDFASWDEPIDWWPRLIADVLEPLARNEPASYRRTDWSGASLELWGEVEPGGLVLLEGVTASREAFQPYLAFSIWVETDRATRLARGLDRDGEAAREQWERWMAEEDGYIRREQPAERADAVVQGEDRAR
jgi:uridine kinase